MLPRAYECVYMENSLQRRYNGIQLQRCVCVCEWKENREAAFPVSARDQKRCWKVGDDDDVIYIYIYRENALPRYYIIILLEHVGEQSFCRFLFSYLFGY